MESDRTEYQTVYFLTDEGLTSNLRLDDHCDEIIVDGTNVIDAENSHHVNGQNLKIENKENISEKNKSISNIFQKESANDFLDNIENVSMQQASCDKIVETQTGNAFVDNNQQSCNVFDQNLAMFLDQYNNSNINCESSSPKELNQSTSTVLDEDSTIALDKNAAIADSENLPIDGIVENLQNTLDKELFHSMFKTLLCSYCSKQFRNFSTLKKHLLRVHKFPASLYSCSQCKAVFKLKAKLQKHCKEAHQQKLGQDTFCINDNIDTVISEKDHGIIRCVECNIKFGNRRTLREHLAKCHDVNIAEQEIRFPNMIAFKKWKLDVERRDRTFFLAAHGIQKGSRCNRSLYRCHRSGRLNALEHEKKAYHGLTSKLTGITCTAMMIVCEYQEEVRVKYCLQHYGHGQDITFVQLSAEEQAAIDENVSKGISLDEQLDDIKHAQSLAEHFQARRIQLQDIHFINKAFASEIYNAGMSAIEYVEQWVRVCSEMEDSPILLYRQEVGSKNQGVILIIMTEFQKHILMTSTKEVMCLDTQYSARQGYNFLTALIVMDDQDVAFPVAYCISSEVNRDSMLEFLSSVKESTGPLSCSYFMSNNNKIFYEAWQEVMQDNSKWIWNIWSFNDNIRKHLVRFIKHVPTREATFRCIRTIMECNNHDVFATMLKNFKNSMCQDFREFFESQYGSNQEMWACCYRKGLKYSTNFYLEYVHRTLVQCFTKARCKQLDKFLMVVMKYLRFKMINRLTNMLDEEKIDIAKKTISMCHDMGLEIECEGISSLSDKIWLIKYKNEVDAYVTQEYTSCPEMCDLKCPDCDVCVHMYSCTCVHSIINANMCKHIHAVVWKLLTPHFSEPSSPEPDPSDNVCEIPDEEPPIPDKSPELLNCILKRLQGIFKQVRMNKCQLNKNSLSEVLRLLDKCYQICSGSDATCNALSKSTQTDAVSQITSVPKLNGLSPQDGLNSGNITPLYMTTSNTGWNFISNSTLNSYNIPNNSNFQPVTPTPGFVAVQNIALNSASNGNPASIIVIPSNPAQNSVGYSACNAPNFISVASSNSVLNPLDNSLSISEKQDQVAATLPPAISNPILKVFTNTLSSDKCKANVTSHTQNTNSLPTIKKPHKRTFECVSQGSASNPVPNIKRIKKIFVKRIRLKDNSPSLPKNVSMIIKSASSISGNLNVSSNIAPNSVINKRPVKKKQCTKKATVSDVSPKKDSVNAADSLGPNSPSLIETADSSSDSFPDASDYIELDFVQQLPASGKSPKDVTCAASDGLSVNTATNLVSKTLSTVKPAAVQLLELNKNSGSKTASKIIHVPVSYSSDNNASNAVSFSALSGSSTCKYSDVATISSDKISSSKKPSDKISSAKKPSDKISSTKKPSEKISSAKKPSDKMSSVKKPSDKISSVKKPSDKISSTMKPSDEKKISSQIVLNLSSLEKNTKLDAPCVIESYQSLNFLSDKSKETDCQGSDTEICQDSVSKKSNVVKKSASSSDISEPELSSVVEFSVLTSSSDLSSKHKKNSSPHIPVLVKASKPSTSSPSATSNTPIIINYPDSTKLRSFIQTNIKTEPLDRDENSEIPETQFPVNRKRCSVCNCSATPDNHLFMIPSIKERYERWFTALKWNILPERVDYIINNAKVCEKHFTEASFCSTLRNKLSKFACPFLTEDNSLSPTHNDTQLNSTASQFNLT